MTRRERFWKVIRVHQWDPRLQRRMLAVLVLSTLIGFLVYFDIQQGFSDWEQVHSKLSIFVAINVNIVLLAILFYMVLRNLIKLLYERNQEVLGVSLKTKLTIAFLVLSLPATLFHLFASSFISSVLERWLESQHRSVIQGAVELTQSYHENLKTLMQDQGLLLQRALERNPQLIGDLEQLNQVPDVQPIEGIIIYQTDQTLLYQALRSYKANKYWRMPSPPLWQEVQDASNIWHKEDLGKRFLFRYFGKVHVNGTSLVYEIFYPATKALTGTINDLSQQIDNNTIFTESQDLIKRYYLIMFMLMTLAIAFVAVWLAFYLARGFVKPIEYLAEGTRRVSGGELGFQVTTDRSTPLDQDFSQLIDSFNLMSQQLSENREDLERHTRFVELVLENIKTGVMSLELDGSINGLNRSAKMLLQLKTSDHLNQHYRDVLDRESFTTFDSMFEALRQTPQRTITKNWTLMKYGVPIQIAVTLLTLEGRDGQSVGFVSVYENITEIQRFQRAQAWRDIARRIAHEIKNPLTPIQLGTQQIRRKYLDQVADKEVLDHATQTIIEEVELLKKMVKEFSNFARLPESNPKPYQLNEIIHEVEGLYRNALEERITLVLELDPNLPICPLDKEQMKRVFINLIDNATAAIESQGTITIVTEMTENNSLLRVRVSDNGVGVPNHLLERLFEPYATTKEHGTGLGLSIVSRIVSDHNGFVNHRNLESGGSEFTIELPVG